MTKLRQKVDKIGVLVETGDVKRRFRRLIIRAIIVVGIVFQKRGLLSTKQGVQGQNVILTKWPTSGQIEGDKR